MLFHLEYEEPLFRPPSEAYALIFQVTIGCSWNKCAFCQMYAEKRFRVRKEEEVFSEIERAADCSRDLDNIRRVFLADGDALVLPTKRLLSIFQKIKQCFPKVRRISSYALPKNILRKSKAELTELQNAGLKLIYLGAESGSDEVLKKINKGESYQSTVDGLKLAKESGIKSSVMILNGLGGIELSREHATGSAKLINLTQPEYLSVLSLMFPLGKERFVNHFGKNFKPLSKQELFRELKLFLEHLELDNTIFRTDHASNYLVLKGMLNRDKEIFLAQITKALEEPGTVPIRAQWQRGL